MIPLFLLVNLLLMLTAGGGFRWLLRLSYLRDLGAQRLQFGRQPSQLSRQVALGNQLRNG